jgi:beta-lactam-binding protein with PASTA domain
MKTKGIAIVLALFITLLSFGCGSANNTQTVKVPSIVGLKVSEAEKVITNNNLILQVVDSQYSDTVPIDCIITQNPEENTTVKAGSIVTAVISNGSPNVSVPDLTGKTIDVATQILKEVSLYISDITEVENIATPGTILSQDPQPNTILPPNSGVKVTVSIGTFVIVPNLIGMTLEQAKSTINSSGLVLYKVDVIDSNVNAPSQTVIYQYPMPGLKVKQGGQVRLQVKR